MTWTTRRPDPLGTTTRRATRRSANTASRRRRRSSFAATITPRRSRSARSGTMSKPATAPTATAAPIASTTSQSTRSIRGFLIARRAARSRSIRMAGLVASPAAARVRSEGSRKRCSIASVRAAGVRPRESTPLRRSLLRLAASLRAIAPACVAPLSAGESSLRENCLREDEIGCRRPCLAWGTQARSARSAGRARDARIVWPAKERGASRVRQGPARHMSPLAAAAEHARAAHAARLASRLPHRGRQPRLVSSASRALAADTHGCSCGLASWEEPG